MAPGTVSPPAPPGNVARPPEREPAADQIAPVPRRRPPSRAAPGRLRARASAVLPPLLLGAAVLLLWQIARWTDAAPTLLLPAPVDVLRSFGLLLTVPALRGYIAGTVIASLGGCALGAFVALPLGYAIARSPLLARAVQPYLAASQALPAVALAPLIALWLGYGVAPRMGLCALIVFFPMVVTTVLGLRGLDREVLDAARVEGAGRWSLLWRIELPLALPSILAGLRTSLTLSITGAVVGEFVLGGGSGLFDQGLGQLLGQFLNENDSAGVFATLLALALLAALYYGLARLAERRFSYLEV
jgi:NitT/TauT family transport system permease protein